MPRAKRVVADCRLMPSKTNCTLCISGTEKEVLPVAVQHAIDVHGHKKSAKLTRDVKATLKPEK